MVCRVIQDLDLSFTEPYFLYRDFAAGFDLFRREREFQNSSFDSRDLGASLRGSYPLSEYLSQSFRYTISQEEILPNSDAPQSIIDQAGEVIISRLDQTQTMNQTLEPARQTVLLWCLCLHYFGKG